MLPLLRKSEDRRHLSKTFEQKLDDFAFGLHYLCPKTKHIDSIDESIIDQW